jgi:DNA-binding transcriptional ArsR family regulator
MLNQSAAIDRVFAALADSTRRSILIRLSRGPASVSELAAPLKMSLAAVVQHIQILEQSAVISTRKQGRVRTCRIEPATLASAEEWLKNRRQMWESQFDLLGEVLREEKAAGRAGKDES